MIIEKIKNNKKILWLTVPAVVLVISGYFTYSQYHNKSEGEELKPTTELNLDPPTEEEKKSGDEHKKAIVERDERINNQQSSPDKKSVKPIITYAGQYGPQNNVEVGGYVDGIFEEGGTCIATFTQGSLTFSRQSQAVRNAQSVDCPTIKASSSDFSSKGEWSVTLSYESSTATGKSDPQSIEVN